MVVSNWGLGFVEYNFKSDIKRSCHNKKKTVFDTQI